MKCFNIKFYLAFLLCSGRSEILHARRPTYVTPDAIIIEGKSNDESMNLDIAYSMFASNCLCNIYVYT